MKKIDPIDRNVWVIEASKLAQKDLRPCFEFWGWDFSEDAALQVSGAAWGGAGRGGVGWGGAGWGRA